MQCNIDQIFKKIIFIFCSIIEILASRAAETSKTLTSFLAPIEGFWVPDLWDGFDMVKKFLGL